jgi:hypothetical protein
VVRSFTIYSFNDGSCWLYTAVRQADGVARHKLAFMEEEHLFEYCHSFLGSDLSVVDA